MTEKVIMQKFIQMFSLHLQVTGAYSYTYRH
jgi:hypothetical protein